MTKLLTVSLLSSFFFSFSQSQQQVIDSLFFGTGGVKSKFPDVGLVIGICINGQTNYYAFGTRTVNETAPLDSTTLFEIGSATKTFTALLLAQAIEDKKIGKNDFIDSYLPKGFHLLPKLQHKIKLTYLASHQSGLPNLSNDTYFADLLQKDPKNPFRFVDSAYLYKVLTETSELHNYGKYQYNNYAFSLLGDVLARLHHTTYAALIDEKILAPLHMKSTTLSIPKDQNVAGLYNQQGKPQDYLILDAANPAGGLKSNAVDLMKYLKAHFANSSVISAVQLTRQSYYKDEQRTVGLGWDIEQDYYQKDGDTFGNSMLMRYNPTKQLAVLVLMNHQNGQLARDVVNFIYNSLNK